MLALPTGESKRSPVALDEPSTPRAWPGRVSLPQALQIVRMSRVPSEREDVSAPCQAA